MTDTYFVDFTEWRAALAKVPRKRDPMRQELEVGFACLEDLAAMILQIDTLQKFEQAKPHLEESYLDFCAVHSASTGASAKKITQPILQDLSQTDWSDGAKVKAVYNSRIEKLPERDRKSIAKQRQNMDAQVLKFRFGFV